MRSSKHNGTAFCGHGIAMSFVWWISRTTSAIFTTRKNTSCDSFTLFSTVRAQNGIRNFTNIALVYMILFYFIIPSRRTRENVCGWQTSKLTRLLRCSSRTTTRAHSLIYIVANLCRNYMIRIVIRRQKLYGFLYEDSSDSDFVCSIFECVVLCSEKMKNGRNQIMDINWLQIKERERKTLSQSLDFCLQTTSWCRWEDDIYFHLFLLLLLCWEREKAPKKLSGEPLGECFCRVPEKRRRESPDNHL